MSKNRRQDGDELIETTNGSVRIAYDADTELYTWRRPDGVLMEGKYGPVNVVRQPSPPRPHPPGTFLVVFLLWQGQERTAKGVRLRRRLPGDGI